VRTLEYKNREMVSIQPKFPLPVFFGNTRKTAIHTACHPAAWKK
jgi:hypothetical protein